MLVNKLSSWLVQRPDQPRLDPSILASGQLRRGVDFNLSINNLTNRNYYETQNYFDRVAPSRMGGNRPVPAEGSH